MLHVKQIRKWENMILRNFAVSEYASTAHEIRGFAASNRGGIEPYLFEKVPYKRKKNISVIIVN